MRYLFGLIVGLVSLWLLLSGHYSPIVLSLGAVSCILVVLICHRMNIIDNETVPLHLIRGGPSYIIWLLGQIAQSNWEVAGIIVARARPISPTMVTLRTSEKTELGQVIFANSITLTPGTVTVGLNEGIATVHALSSWNALDLEDGYMDRRVRKLEQSGGITADNNT